MKYNLYHPIRKIPIPTKVEMFCLCAYDSKLVKPCSISSSDLRSIVQRVLGFHWHTNFYTVFTGTNASRIFDGISVFRKILQRYTAKIFYFWYTENFCIFLRYTGLNGILLKTLSVCRYVEEIIRPDRKTDNQPKILLKQKVVIQFLKYYYIKFTQKKIHEKYFRCYYWCYFSFN